MHQKKSLLQMETNLADFAEILGETNVSDYRQAAANRKEAVNAVLWSASAGRPVLNPKSRP